MTSFANPISLTIVAQNNSFCKESNVKSSSIDEPSILYPDKTSYDNGTWAQLTTTAFTPDGNITEWDTEGIISDTFDGITIYLAYDAINVYVALSWLDNEVSDKECVWNKTSTASDYDLIYGDEDAVRIGFYNGTFIDFWFWTATNRTADNYAYEFGGQYYSTDADGGNLPHIMNSDGNRIEDWYKPIYDNDSIPITDHSSIPVNTKIKCWFEDTPTGSQTDVEMGMTHNGTAYFLEFVRALDTGNSDDIVLDLTNNDIDLRIGRKNHGWGNDFYFYDSSYRIFHENTPAEFTVEPIPSLVNESLLLQGTVFDDYRDYRVIIWLDTWADIGTSPQYASVNKIAGIWSHTLPYDEMNMPLGENNVWITLDAPYEDNISISYTTTIQDNLAPIISGVVNVSNRYPLGVPLDEEYVIVSAGLADNYDVNSLTAKLFSYHEDDAVIEQTMIQYYPDSYLYSANITIDSSDNPTHEHNYSYYIQVWDKENNNIISNNFTFFVAIDLDVTTSQESGIAFNSIINTLILTGCLIIIVRKKKKK